MFPQGNAKVGRRNAKLRRLQRKGMLPSKDELAEMSARAVTSKPIQKLPAAAPEATLGHTLPPWRPAPSTRYPR